MDIGHHSSVATPQLHRSPTKSESFQHGEGSIGEVGGGIKRLKRQAASLQQKLAKATDRNQKQILYAPTSGQVQEIQVSTVGGVVTEAQQLKQPWMKSKGLFMVVTCS